MSSGWSEYRIFEVLKGALHCQSGQELVPFDFSEIKAFISGYLTENSLSMAEVRAGIAVYWRDLLWRYGGIAGYIRSLTNSEPSEQYAKDVVAMVNLAEHLRDEGPRLEESLRVLVDA